MLLIFLHLLFKTGTCGMFSEVCCACKSTDQIQFWKAEFFLSRRFKQTLAKRLETELPITKLDTCYGSSEKEARTEYNF